jgi:hypothetical protein
MSDPQFHEEIGTPYGENLTGKLVTYVKYAVELGSGTQSNVMRFGSMMTINTSRSY